MASNKYQTKSSRIIRRNIIRFFTVIIILSGLAGLLYYLTDRGYFDLKTISVTGNKQYCTADITNQMMDKPYCRYTPIFYIKYKYFKPKNLPFIADLDIKLDGLNSVSINVYEKPIVAGVKYKEGNLFIDSEGIVVKKDKNPIDDIISVEGMKVDKVELYKKLDAENIEQLDEIQQITRVMDRYKNKPVSMKFDDDGQIRLYYDKLVVKIGNIDNIGEKMDSINAVLPELPDRKGYIDLSRFRHPGDYIVFSKIQNASNS